jgi:hypothetical protein
MPTERRLACTLGGSGGGERASAGETGEKCEMEYVVMGDTALGDCMK